MSMKLHNKKRNVGLIYEFFTRYIGQAIIERRDGDVTRARSLLRKHFNKGTDLYRELKMFRALYESSVGSPEFAVHTINRVREAATTQSQSRLDMEKSSLIHEINTRLNGQEFFNRNIPDYKTYATVQVLLNNWRSSELNESVGYVVELERKLVEHMCQPSRTSEQLNAASMTEQDVDGLVVRLMTEKVNQKFGDSLDAQQKRIINLYVFSDGNEESRTQLREELDNARTQTVGAIARARAEFSQDQSLSQKLNEVRTLLSGQYADTSNPTDDLVQFYLGLSNLRAEINSND